MSRKLIHIFSQVLGLSLGLFIFIVFCTIYILVTTEIRFFALKSKKKEKVLDRGQNDFSMRRQKTGGCSEGLLGAF